jgi:biotin/methionine sulfoxide reductase
MGPLVQFDPSMKQRFPHLAHWGAFTAVVEDGRLIRCEPFAGDSNPSPMLDSIVPLVYSPQRVQKPAVRRSWLRGRSREGRGDEDFVEVTWDQALDLVAGEIARVRAEQGPAGIFCGSYGWSSAGRFHHARTQIRRFHFKGGGGVDQVGNYSWGAAQFLLPHVIGSYTALTGRVTDWPSIVAHGEVFVAFGGLPLRNTQVASGGAGDHMLKGWLEKLVAAGVRIINISPSREDCADFLNAEWIPIRPNTDVALMLALAYELQREGVHDRAFLATHCAGYDHLEAYLLGQTDGSSKTPEWAEAITGIPAARIRALALQLKGARSYLTCTYSLQRAHRGEQPFWMVIALACMLGQVGLPGGGFGFGHGSMNGVGNPRYPVPGLEMQAGPNPAGLSIPVARLTDMLEHPGAAYSFGGEQRSYPDVRLVHWAGGNPFHHHQQLNRLRKAWQKPETVIVQEVVWTATARHADIVLPATTTLERNDVGGSSRDRYLFAMHQAIAPQHQARNDFDIFTELAERLGYEAAYTEGLGEAEWLRRLYEGWRNAAGKGGFAAPEFGDFWAAGHVELPPPAKDSVDFADFRADPNAHPLATPSGRIELYSEAIAAFELADMPPHPAWLPPVEWLGDSLAQTYPLQLITVQPGDRLHSQLDQTPAAQANKVSGLEAIFLNAGDARARGIAEGDRVEVFNARGITRAGARLCEGILSGVAVMATGAWFTPGESAELAGNPNVLTLDIGSSSLTQGPNAMSCLVDVRKWVEA